MSLSDAPVTQSDAKPLCVTRNRPKGKSSDAASVLCPLSDTETDAKRHTVDFLP